MTTPVIPPSTVFGQFVDTVGNEGFYYEVMQVLSSGLGVNRQGVRFDPYDATGPAGIRIGGSGDAIGAFGRTPRTIPSALTVPSNSSGAAPMTAVSAPAVTGITAAPAEVTAVPDAAVQSGAYVQADVESIRALANDLKAKYNAAVTLLIDLRARAGEHKTLSDDLRARTVEAVTLTTAETSLMTNNANSQTEMRNGLGDTNAGTGWLKLT